MRRLLLVLCCFIAGILCRAESNTVFLPCEPHASVSFEGVTQMGKETHRLKVRMLAFTPSGSKVMVPTRTYYVIYYAGSYGPEILEALGMDSGGIIPFVRMGGPDVVEILYHTGAHTIIRERWKLLGHTAKKESREDLDWREDARIRNEPNHATEPLSPSRDGSS